MRSVPCLFMVYDFSANVIDQSSIHYSLITFEFGLIVENFLHVRFWRRMVCHNSWCVMPFCKTFCEHLSVLDAFRKHWHLGISARWKHVAVFHGRSIRIPIRRACARWFCAAAPWVEPFDKRAVAENAWRHEKAQKVWESHLSGTWGGYRCRYAKQEAFIRSRAVVHTTSLAKD